ncbi:MAG: hypothetical protein AAF889_03100 [Cyanobacteria bacterium P01_D01_bin.73]
MSFEVILILLLALIFFAQWLDSLLRDRRKRLAKDAQSAAISASIKASKESLKAVLGEFREDPLNIEIQSALLQSMSFQGNPMGTGLAYNTVLASLAENPNASILKQLSLDAGRIHYGEVRGGEATVDDEQRIMNDIAVRTQ